jgi:hypothetical protein
MLDRQCSSKTNTLAYFARHLDLEWYRDILLRNFTMLDRQCSSKTNTLAYFARHLNLRIRLDPVEPGWAPWVEV